MACLLGACTRSAVVGDAALGVGADSSTLDATAGNDAGVLDAGPDEEVLIDAAIDDAMPPDGNRPFDAGTPDAAMPDAPEPVPTANCIEDVRPPFEVMRNAPPPVVGQASYRYYPVTIAATQSVDTLLRSVEGPRRFAFLWANRCTQAASNDCRPNAGNLPQITYSGAPTRFGFSNVARANACTIAQLHSLLGEPSAATAVITNNGLRSATSEATLAAPWLSSATDTRGNALFSDVCFLEHDAIGTQLAEVLDGVVLDFEVQDGRSDLEAARFLERFTRTLRERERSSILWTNPVNGGGVASSGLVATNATTIAGYFDAVSILRWSESTLATTADLDEQARFWGGGAAPSAALRAKLYAIFDMSDTSLAEAADTYDWAVANGAFGVAPWRDGAVVPTDCAPDPVLEKIRCLTLGECS